MKKAKIVIADNEDGQGWFIYRVDYVTETDYDSEDSWKSEFIEGESVGIQEGEPVKIGDTLEGVAQEIELNRGESK